MKTRRVYLIIVIILFVLLITAASASKANDNQPTKEESPVSISVSDTRQNDDAANDEIEIVLEESPSAGATDMAEDQSNNESQDQNAKAAAGFLDSKTDNPVLAFFNSIATTFSASFQSANNTAQLSGNQISIEVAEDENEDADVSHEVTIDVEDYPISNVTDENSTILIYHTHTREAYMPEFAGQYVPCGDSRTDDTQNNICAVGEKLASLLSNSYGFSVYHDTTMNEAEVFNKSYDKSLETIQKDIAANPNIDVFIDIHRDSVDDTAYAQSQVIEANGKRYAKVMFVVGRGDTFTGDEAPDWEQNYALAQAVTDEINAIMPGLGRDVMVKKNRYNQHLSNNCMLIEIGYSANTITEAENSIDIVAQALAAVLNK